MGRWSPPLYDEMTSEEILDEISKVDEQINELAIKRESLAKAFKEKVKEANTSKA